MDVERISLGDDQSEEDFGAALFKNGSLETSHRQTTKRRNSCEIAHASEAISVFRPVCSA